MVVDVILSKNEVWLSDFYYYRVTGTVIFYGNQGPFDREKFPHTVISAKTR